MHVCYPSPFFFSFFFWHISVFGSKTAALCIYRAIAQMQGLLRELDSDMARLHLLSLAGITHVGDMAAIVGSVMDQDATAYTTPRT